MCICISYMYVYLWNFQALNGNKGIYILYVLMYQISPGHLLAHILLLYFHLNWRKKIWAFPIQDFPFFSLSVCFGKWVAMGSKKVFVLQSYKVKLLSLHWHLVDLSPWDVRRPFMKDNIFYILETDNYSFIH